LYTLSLQRRFEAWHHLIGGDFGAESEPHTHPYVLDVRIEGPELDEHGYLVDLLEVNKLIDEIMLRFEGKDLNQDRDFKDLNPSLENFARIVATQLSQTVRGRNLSQVSVRIWESESAWASYRIDL
jgi:6-pyruvoyltetrahydropterin/6-carboxytetrahydropterin synthase